MATKYGSDILIEIQGMKDRVDKIMEESYERFDYYRDGSNKVGMWKPITDVYETMDSYIIQMELPGIEKRDINIEVREGELLICGERRLVKEVRGCSYHILERSYGPFARKFSIPENGDQDAISASYRDGLLVITVPKREIEKTTFKIDVKVEE